MARPSYPRAGEPLPAPLPPETRTVGQLVAETIKLYGDRFFAALPLGFAVAAAALLTSELHGTLRDVLALTVAPLLCSTALVRAVQLVRTPEPSRRRVAAAVLVGVVAFLPIGVSRLWIFPGIYPLVLVWFAVAGLGVAAVLLERVPLRRALARGFVLGRADAAHALGSILTLVVTIFLTGLVLFFLIESFGHQAVRVAAFLALLVLSPLFLLGSALLYVDQAARAARDG